MVKLNRLLARQLKLLKLNREQAPTVEQWNALLEAVSRNYEQAESDRYLQERALSISSREMRESLTREKEMSLQLAQASRLSSLGTLASGVAHELNNPLGGVKGYAEMMLEESPLSSEDRGKLERIVALVDRMSNIVKHLLKLARKPEEKEVGPVTVQNPIKDSLELFKAQLKYDKITLEVNLPTENLTVWGDGHRLTSVFQNIVNNARDEFMRASEALPEAPKICIFVDSARSTQDLVCICIRDNAGGIPQKIIDRIFDPFFTTKEVGKGTGLGLSLSRTIIEELGGRLEVASVNRETSFFITLQRYKTESDSVQSIAQSTARSLFPRIPGHKKTVLLVDDDMDMLNVLEHKLQHIFKVAKTTSSAEAASWLKGQKFDILITDLKMPELSGDQLIQMARDLQPHIGAVLISGHAAAVEIDLSRLPGPKIVQIGKPLPENQILIQLILSAEESQAAAS